MQIFTESVVRTPEESGQTRAKHVMFGLLVYLCDLDSKHWSLCAPPLLHQHGQYSPSEVIKPLVFIINSKRHCTYFSKKCTQMLGVCVSLITFIPLNLTEGSVTCTDFSE